jgi:hypothetical protein
VTTPKTSACPHCGGVGVWRSVASEAAYVDYYRRFTCANVWTMPKDNPEPSDSVT